MKVVESFKNKKLNQKKTTENLKLKKTKKLRSGLSLKNGEKYKKKINKDKALNLSEHEDSLNKKKKEKKRKEETKSLSSTKKIKNKKINKKEGKKSDKFKIKTNDSESEDLDDNEELCDDDNLFMPSTLKNKKCKSLINETSKQQKKRKNLKKKQCAAEYLKLNEYNQEYEKDLLMYAMNGLYKYLDFLKNYKKSTETENKIDNKKPKHLYV
ncbi:conserved Plasmodium protein, unknown function [Plasmodium relictum]|uniref:Uncharacterized protein n=1 Tax=Plasmodium relictum TaxID=85471 RepID=A0A1J1H0X4_PLARL|nr:conserved Plasmodium protein, unknown function [Plasmodium relictum]CRG98437.1 conserved Plasmodium protein, unknown function [Plasmodium relictum]